MCGICYYIIQLIFRSARLMINGLFLANWKIILIITVIIIVVIIGHPGRQKESFKECNMKVCVFDLVQHW